MHTFFHVQHINFFVYFSITNFCEYFCKTACIFIKLHAFSKSASIPSNLSTAYIFSKLHLLHQIYQLHAFCKICIHSINNINCTHFFKCVIQSISSTMNVKFFFLLLKQQFDQKRYSNGSTDEHSHCRSVLACDCPCPNLTIHMGQKPPVNLSHIHQVLPHWCGIGSLFKHATNIVTGSQLLAARRDYLWIVMQMYTFFFINVCSY